jgi:hypothetical protein
MQITEFDPYKKASALYALDRGAPKFDLIEVKDKKDQQYNLAIKQAQHEFDNLKQIADVIQQQALQIKERIELTQKIYSAEYNFELVPDNVYWLAQNTEKNILILCLLGPEDWSAGAPSNYNYIQKVKYLANGLWEKN